MTANETCQPIDGSAAIHPHNLGLLMLRGIFSTGPFGQAKQCVINAFDTGYLLSAVEVMAIIIYLAHNMDEEASAPGAPSPDTLPPHLCVCRCWSRFTQRSRTQPMWPSWWSWSPQQVQRMWQPRLHIILLQCPR
jgi:hypothetical protein